MEKIKNYCRQTNCPIHKKCSLYISDNKYRDLRKQKDVYANIMLPNPDGRSDCNSFIAKKGK